MDFGVWQLGQKNDFFCNFTPSLEGGSLFDMFVQILTILQLCEYGIEALVILLWQLLDVDLFFFL